jgi:hypothetical protein
MQSGRDGMPSLHPKSMKLLCKKCFNFVMVNPGEEFVCKKFASRFFATVAFGSIIARSPPFFLAATKAVGDWFAHLNWTQY